MKTFFILLLFQLQFLFSFAQDKRIEEKKIPVMAVDYIRINYPSANQKEYYQKKENDSIFYEAEFKVLAAEYNLKFSLKGTLLETEREIELDEINPMVQQCIRSVLKEKFQKARIRKIQEVNPAGKKQFEVNVKVKKSAHYSSGFYDVIFDSDGQLLRIEEERLNSIESTF